MVRGFFVAVLLAGTMASGAIAEDSAYVEYEIVVESGDTAFESSTFVSFVPPAINALRSVAFNAAYSPASGVNRGIWWSYVQDPSPRVLELVARHSSDLPSPYSQSSFDSSTNSLGGTGFGRPLILDDNSLAFIGQTDHDAIEGNQVLVKRDFAGALEVLEIAPNASVVDPAFNNYYFALVDANNDDLSHLVMPRGTGDRTVGWYAKLRDPNLQDQDRNGGMFCATDPGEHNNNTLLRQKDYVPGLSNTYVNSATAGQQVFNGMTMNADKIAAISVWTDKLRPGSNDYKRVVLVSETNSTDFYRTVAFEGNSAPGTSSTFANLDFTPVINDESNAAFRAQTADGKWGIWAEETSGSGFDDHSLELVVSEDSDVPQRAIAEWLGFGDPVIASDGTILFVGAYENNSAEYEGIFGVTPGAAYTRVWATNEGGSSNTPKKPNHNGIGGTVGLFTGADDPELGFSDPSVNSDGNV